MQPALKRQICCYLWIKNISRLSWKSCSSLRMTFTFKWIFSHPVIRNNRMRRQITYGKSKFLWNFSCFSIVAACLTLSWVKIWWFFCVAKRSSQLVLLTPLSVVNSSIKRQCWCHPWEESKTQRHSVSRRLFPSITFAIGSFHALAVVASLSSFFRQRVCALYANHSIGSLSTHRRSCSAVILYLI